MSQTAKGIIACSGGTPFTATFVLLDGSGKHINFPGHFSTSVQAFSSTNATLKYDDLSQLTATRQFTGHVGEKDVKLEMENGPVIDGILDLPISPASSVSGSGVWAIH